MNSQIEVIALDGNVVIIEKVNGELLCTHTLTPGKATDFARLLLSMASAARLMMPKLSMN